MIGGKSYYSVGATTNNYYTQFLQLHSRHNRYLKSWVCYIWAKMTWFSVEGGMKQVFLQKYGQHLYIVDLLQCPNYWNFFPIHLLFCHFIFTETTRVNYLFQSLAKKLALRKWELTYFICSSWDNLSEGDKVSAKRNPSHKKSTTPYDPNAYVVRGPKAAMITAKRKELEIHHSLRKQMITLPSSRKLMMMTM